VRQHNNASLPPGRSAFLTLANATALASSSG
jgi:hypothetical protein